MIDKNKNNEKYKNRFFSLICSKIYLLLIIVCLISYLSGINGEFVFDDKIIKNDELFSPQHSAGFWNCWQRSYWGEKKSQGLYRPLALFSFWVNSRICGLYSPGFRIVNLLIHLLTTLMIYKLGTRLKLTRLVSCLAALIFAVHPIHTEAVIPAFGRSELLCAFFLVAGLFFHCDRGKHYTSALFSALCFILTCWSKEHGLIFLPLCIICDIYQNNLTYNGIKKFIKAKGQYYFFFYLPALIIILFSRHYGTGSILPGLQSFAPGVDNRLANVSIWEREITALKIQIMAILKFIWPWTLSHDYSYAQIIPSGNIFNLYFLAIVFIVSMIGFFVVLCPKLKKRILFLICLFVISILPASNLIFISGTIFAERLSYIPSIWLSFIVAIILIKCLKKIPFDYAIIITAVVIFSYSIRSNLRGYDWKNSERLAYAGIATSPQSAKMWNNLAVEMGKKKKLQAAISSCDRALQIHQEYHVALANRALYYAQSGNSRAAENDFRKAFKLHSKSDFICFNYGVFLANLGRLKEAETIWAYSLKNNPDQPELKENLKKLKLQLEDKRKKDQSHQ